MKMKISKEPLRQLQFVSVYGFTYSFLPYHPLQVHDTDITEVVVMAIVEGEQEG